MEEVVASPVNAVVYSKVRAPVLSPSAKASKPWCSKQSVQWDLRPAFRILSYYSSQTTQDLRRSTPSQGLVDEMLLVGVQGFNEFNESPQ